MMSGPKRNPDKLNTIGVVVVGICGAVLVYVSIIALQAFYMSDSSEVQTMADYGGQDKAHQSLRAIQTFTIEDCGPNSKPEAGKQQTYRIPIKYAIKLVADGAKVDPSNLVPTSGRSDKPTILPIFGRPKAVPKPDPTKPDAGGVAPGIEPTGAGSAATPPAGGTPPPEPAGSAAGGTSGAKIGSASSPPVVIKPLPTGAAKPPAAGSAAKPPATTPAKPATGSAAKPPAPKPGSNK
jgi:hypothetical protein